VKIDDRGGSARPKEGVTRKPQWDTLVGVSLPFWAETVDLVRKAHYEAFPAFVTLGWDIALTAAGPVLLETNVSWAVANHQFRTGPLGRTALGDVIDELLSTAPDRLSANPAT